MATVKFDGLVSGKKQARVHFEWPEATDRLCRETFRCYYRGELMQAAREHDWMAPVLAAALAAGLR